ncbi:MAG: hypothetical protein J6P98_03560 [Clostridia bacterium]|nr:hypothetical protein [Clostridia bacterium]
MSKKNKELPAGKKTAKEPMSQKEKRSFIIKAVAAGLAFIAALVSFGLFAKQCTDKEAGWYSIDPNTDEFAPRYASGVSLQYYFGGESEDNRVAMNAVRAKYSEALAHIFKLLDPQNAYEGYTNLHYLNTHPGEGVELDPVLFDILKDALAQTEAGGFDLFGGALFYEWQGVTILEDPQDFDPALDPDEKERIDRLAALNSDRSNFSLEIVDENHHIVRFNVSEDYMAALEELEISCPVLDLGYLKEAYELVYTAGQLEEAGYHNGFLTTESGLTLAMSGSDKGVFLLYSIANNEPHQAARVAMKGGSACCCWRSFPLEEGEPQYYTVTGEGGALMRHPHFDPATGEIGSEVLSVCVVDEKGDLPSACAAANRLICSGAEEARGTAKAESSATRLAAYVLVSDTMTVNIDSAHASSITLTEGFPFRQETF